ncbi:MULTISPECIES: acylphosphatase [unclassified Pseudodesulfovibrio]|uniref:acylphosphatase n=1 Tax=unclassified Pseudodesulfovibrio TaxID=2661612 RepID=UPI000FEB9C2E|nr:MULTISPECIES: acylphosphatase [unclassified Pseudodesulfovibrio]MCJ2164454.1 acylphosphatase [Pseudodesulfovibrio sp. S3-i]RWU04656.1 acylphosphatase [Pseudodesulfovibrio sp. S3]
MQSYKCTVHGKVTGGNFQLWVLNAAQRLNLNGWVRNIAEGKAEILLQGDDDNYAAFLERLKTEAPIVDKGEIAGFPIEYDKVYDKFEIRG